VADHLDPFHIRPDLGKLFLPLVGNSILELGDKIGGGRVYKTYFESLGFRHVSVDINGLHGALPLDLTKPLNLGTFDMVSNIGTSEHVSEKHFAGQIECWRNMLAAMHIGSVLVCDTPAPGGWIDHGAWYPTEKFYRELAAQNGMTIELCATRLWRAEEILGRKVTSARMVKVEDVPFSMPKGLMYHNYTRQMY
jgi:hypothetical protein